MSEHKAYVSRYDSNANPGAQTWDAGGDILLVDPSVPKIVGHAAQPMPIAKAGACFASRLPTLEV